MALQPQIYLPADTVCALGSRAREMYFISKGTVTVHGAEGQVLKALHSGEFLGELGLLHDTRRSADVVAVTYVDTFLLTRDGFTRSLEDRPEPEPLPLPEPEPEPEPEPKP